MKRIFVSILFLLTQLGYSQWVQQSSPVLSNFEDVFFVNNNLGFAAGGLNVIKTTNGGSNWFTIWSSLAYHVKGICFVNSATGYLVGDYSIYKTTDGGNSWSQQYITTGYELVKVDFATTDTGYIAAGDPDVDDGEILRTTNGGSSWLPVNFTMHYISCLEFIGPNTGYFGGSVIYGYGNSRLYKTTNGGLNLQIVLGGSGKLMSGMSFISVDSGYVVDDFALYYTTNGGTNWSLQGIPNLSDVWATNFDSVYIIGTAGRIMRTTDGGLTWDIQVSGTTQNLSHIYFIGKDTGYIVGNNGVILKTTNGGAIGVEPISSETPREFSLYQNYPNPFNPVTKIKFDITPLSSVGEGPGVRLAVYDILSREVEVLVNERLSPGTYEVSWDASKYPSGVYFYKLTSYNNSIETYTITKKMVVLK